MKKVESTKEENIRFSLKENSDNDKQFNMNLHSFSNRDQYQNNNVKKNSGYNKIKGQIKPNLKPIT